MQHQRGGRAEARLHSQTVAALSKTTPSWREYGRALSSLWPGSFWPSEQFRQSIPPEKSPSWKGPCSRRSHLIAGENGPSHERLACGPSRRVTGTCADRVLDGQPLGSNPSAHLAVWSLPVYVEFVTNLGDGSPIRAVRSAVYVILWGRAALGHPVLSDTPQPTAFQHRPYSPSDGFRPTCLVRGPNAVGHGAIRQPTAARPYGTSSGFHGNSSLASRAVLLLRAIIR